MKLKLLLMVFLSAFVLAGCTIEPGDDTTDPGTNPNEDPKDTTELRNERTLAYSSYLAASFLSSETQEGTDTSSTAPTFLAAGDEAMLEIEKELGEVSGYFSRLKVFLDHGLENPFTIETGLDVNEDYDIEMRYTVENRTYTMLFNEDSEGNLEGVLIMNGNEYALEGSREVENETDEGENESEEEISLRTTDTETDSYVEIEIEAEEDSEEYAFSMSIEMMTNGVEKSLSIEFESDEEEVSIELETSEGNEYEFYREIDDDVIEYYFEYSVNGTEGEVELTVTENENGENVYHYTIEEDGEEKVISETEDDDDDDDDETDDNDDEESDESEDDDDDSDA